jgi:hypothetical protein
MNEKFDGLTTSLASIDQTTLTPLVQSALGSKAIEAVSWEFEQLHGGIGAGTAVYRFSGQGQDQSQTIPWSLILKILRPEGGSADVSAWNYYKREADAYQSGCLNDMPDGLAAPRCFGVLNHPDGTCWMWLEDIQDRLGFQWPLEHYGVVARHLGQFNGAYLVDRSLPDWPWLSSNWLWHYVEQSAPFIEPLRNSQAKPWVRRWLPEEASDQFFHLWAERALYFDALDHLPQTICHFDIFRLNVFARKMANGDNQTEVIDWAFVGRGPIGADLSPLVWMSIALGGVERDKLHELEKVVFEGYLEGLRGAGWQGDPQQVRLGYTAASMRYMFSEIGRILPILLDESLHAKAEQVFGCPLEVACGSFVWTRRHLFSKLEEARELIDILL